MATTTTKTRKKRKATVTTRAARAGRPIVYAEPAARMEGNLILAAILKKMENDGITQVDLCRRTGISQSNMNQFCRARRDFTTHVASRIVDALGMTLE